MQHWRNYSLCHISDKVETADLVQLYTKTENKNHEFTQINIRVCLRVNSRFPKDMLIVAKNSSHAIVTSALMHLGVILNSESYR